MLSVLFLLKQMHDHLTDPSRCVGFNVCLLALCQGLQRLFSRMLGCAPENSLSLMSKQYDTAVTYLII